ncbi:recombinase family protein [Vibrio harveyi]|uniref:recombinase family protein n=1 Tax=Vibrio harveyi TaxID=669 RepID=UPI003CE6ACEC
MTLAQAFIYQYSRISTTEQLKGRGLTRQKSDEIAHQLSVDYKLPIYAKSLVDGGKSAFHGKHLEKGVFGEFIAAIERGEVKKGSILIVESLDRISRQKPNLAQSLMLQIINSGIKIYTSIDNTMYSEDDPDLMSKLILSVLKLSLAHEESSKKSIRSKSNIRLAAEAFLAGDKSAVIPSGRAAPWVTVDKKLKPEVVADIKKMIRLRLEGYGYLAIARTLEMRYTADDVKRILSKKSLYGERIVRVDNLTFTLDDYYPALISKADFLKLQAKSKKIVSTSTRKTCMLTGIAVLHCKHCGHKMTSRYLSSSKLLRLVCETTFIRKGKCDFTINAYLTEFLVIHLCADKIWTTEINTSEYDEQIAGLQIQLDDLKSKLAVLTEIPMMFIEKVSELEKQLAQAKAEKEKATVIVTGDKWENLPDTVKELTTLSEEKRIELRNKIQNSVNKIEVEKIEHNKFNVVYVEFKDGDSRRGASRGTLANPKFYADIKTLVDAERLAAYGRIELNDHFDLLLGKEEPRQQTGHTFLSELMK